MSVFSRLRQTLPSKNFPDENFFTEIVCSFADRHPHAFIAWLREIRATQLNSAKLSIATRHHCPADLEEQLPSKYPDMVIRLTTGGTEEILFLEAKVGSPLSGKNQLQEYARILAKMETGAGKKLLFVTRDYMPQDRDHVLQGIPEDRRPEFLQSRWHELALFLRRQPNALKDTLTAELLTYMKERELDRRSMFDPQDIAALSGFTRAFSVMRATLDGELEDRFGEICGSVNDSHERSINVPRTGMYTLQLKPMYAKAKNTNVDLGFWFGGEPGDYPFVYGDIIFFDKCKDKERIVKALRDFSASMNGRWKEEDLSPASNSGRIVRETSVAAFLEAEDHVAAIKNYLGEILNDIELFTKKFGDVAWAIPAKRT